MCAAQHVARLLLHCVDRKKNLLALGCHSFGPECGLVFLFLDFWTVFLFVFVLLFCFISVLFIFFVILSDCMNSFRKTRTCRTHHAQSNEIYFFSKNSMT